MAIEDAIRRVNGAGYTINNLFQRRDWQWQANVVSPDGKGQHFAVDPCPERALHGAMAEAHKQELMWFALLRQIKRINEQMEERHAPQ
jgi:hypothetical protein